MTEQELKMVLKRHGYKLHAFKDLRGVDSYLVSSDHDFKTFGKEKGGTTFEEVVEWAKSL